MKKNPTICTAVCVCVCVCVPVYVMDCICDSVPVSRQTLRI